MSRIQRWIVFCLFVLGSNAVFAAPDPALLKQLASDDFDLRLAAITQLGSQEDPIAKRITEALDQDTLAKSGDQLLIYDGEKAVDPVSGGNIAVIPANIESISLNNQLRQALDTAKAGAKLFSTDRSTRFAAANQMRENAVEGMLPILDKALATETDADIKQIIGLASARIRLTSADPKQRLTAAKKLAESSDANVIALLQSRLDANTDSTATESDNEVRGEIALSLQSIKKRIKFAESVGTVFTGLSLGSILILAALGLAITYGVMGVINMAHGELLMVGAYATYVVQGIFRQHLPNFIDWYVIAAIPVAFIAAAMVGILIERTVIRHLYGRPLESLLATWGLSLVLIQAARVIFGPQNVELANPNWMSGGITLVGDVVLPWNRIVIIAFAAFVLVLIWLMMSRTRLGLFVRAVTQNRTMAGCVGVPTGRIDTLAFAIGSGVAGLGGCALSQIANVGPAMGQGYIVDAFMVVVVGGVGQLAGAVWAGMGLGLLTKFLEGWTGAVIAKIAVLVFIILFIQKRPQGLFALKGRFVDS